MLTDTLDETGAGTHAFSKEDVQILLITAYGEFKTTGYETYRGEETAIGKYTHFQMACRFAEVVDMVSGRPIPEEAQACRGSATCPWLCETDSVYLAA